MRRYETLTRAQGIEEGLAARVHDPLWLLARQWQFGEFRHEDAASPAFVDVATERHQLDEWRPGTGNEWSAYDAATEPLERLVEQEPAGVPSPRLRLEGGLVLRRLLRARGHSADLATFAVRCPFPEQPELDALDASVRRRLPDGVSLETCLRRLADPGTRAEERAALADAGELTANAATLAELAEEWLAWWGPQTPEGPSSSDPVTWDPHRFEHAFALRATTLPGVELVAAEYAGGRLDWWGVDAVRGPAGEDEGNPAVVSQRAIPAPARFGGMPVPRYWEMEDAVFDPGSIDAAPIDLGRMMLVSFATVYGNDWFVLPLRLPIASLSRITQFAVTDVFGRTTQLTEVGADVDGWNLFGLTQADTPLEPDQERPTSPWFFMAPALPHALESAPVESVLFLRDEMANLAWAVEALVEDDAGRRHDRLAAWSARETGEPEPFEHERYRVASEVPDHWFPITPEQLADQESVRLRLVPLTRLSAGVPREVAPTGRLLADARPGGRSVWLHEEEVPRGGIVTVRTRQHARWHDGSRHLWTGRRKSTGSGEGSSGLVFDTVEEPRRQ